MPKIKVNDIHLYYETYGKGEPLIFIAGFSRDHSTWQGLIDFFAEEYQIIFFDNRGSGQSDCPDFPYTVNMFADDTIGLCKALGINQASFISNSMGGMILQDIAYRYPEFVKCGVIGNSAMKTNIRYELFAKAKLELMQAKAPAKELIEISLPWSFSNQFLDNPAIVTALIKMGLEYPYPISITGYKNQLNALLAFDSRSWVNKINVPCLVTGSDQDAIFPEVEQRQIGEFISNATYHCFEGVGHAPFVEVPSVYVEIVLKYLKTH